MIENLYLAFHVKKYYKKAIFSATSNERHSEENHLRSNNTPERIAIPHAAVASGRRDPVDIPNYLIFNPNVYCNIK